MSEMSRKRQIDDIQQQLDVMRASDALFSDLSPTEHVLKFGKYKGTQYSDICRSDYQYCGWVLNNREILFDMNAPVGSMSEFKQYLVNKLKK